MIPELEKQITKEQLLAKGLKPLTQEELLSLITNNTARGDYEYSGHRIYKTFMNEDGTMEAKNDWDSCEYGNWIVDKNGHLTVSWDGYWEDWTGVAFKIDDEIKFYDIQSDQWRTTFHQIMQGKQDLTI